MTHEVNPPAPGRTNVHSRWAIFNVALALAAALAAVWILGEEQRVRDAIAQLRTKRARDCTPKVRPAPPPPPQALEAPTEPPPEDLAADGYMPKGVDITPAMRLKLEALRARRPAQEQTELLRLGSQAVLPSKTIHVINLWATWCGPCRDEMPDFKTLFARRADWGDSVRFVPIMLKDHTDPASAYASIESAMPDTPVKLADRGYQEPLATLLSAEKPKLFRKNLPVTLVLDCNRRVRWAHFEQLSSRDLKELERYIDQFREELADTSPNAWCSLPWPGNGRCEGLEDTPEHHSLEDCGELKRSPDEPAALLPVEEAVPLPPPPVECPEGTTLTPEGKCKRKLRGNLPKPAPPPVGPQRWGCGNGKCDTVIGEDSRTCCQDCGCSSPRLVCRKASDGEHMCLARLK